MRILDRMKLTYQTHTYECDEFTDGAQTADILGFPHEIMFKTLVTVSQDRAYYVFVIPSTTNWISKKQRALPASSRSP